MEGKDISLKALYSIIAEEDKDSEDNNKMAERSWSWLGMPLSAIAGGIMAFAGFYYANEANQKKQEPIQTPPQIIEKNSVDYTGILTQFQESITQIVDKNNANQENILKQTREGLTQILEKSIASNETLQKQISELREREAATKQALDEACVGAAEVKAVLENLKKEPQETLNEVDILYKRAVQKHKLDLFTDAIADYDKVVFIQPNNALAYYNRASAKAKLAYDTGGRYISSENRKKYQDAAEDYTIFLKLCPNDADAYFNRANALFFSGDPRKALPDYENVIKLEKYLCAAHLSIGIIRIISEQNGTQSSIEKIKILESAIDEFNSAIKADEKFAEAYYLRGSTKYSIDWLIDGKANDAVNKYAKKMREESAADKVLAKNFGLNSALDLEYERTASEDLLYMLLQKKFEATNFALVEK